MHVPTIDLPVPIRIGRRAAPAGHVIIAAELRRLPTDSVIDAVRHVVPHEGGEHMETSVWDGSMLMHPVLNDRGHPIEDPFDAMWRVMGAIMPRYYPRIGPSQRHPHGSTAEIAWSDEMEDTIGVRLVRHALASVAMIDGVLHVPTIGPTLSLLQPYGDEVVRTSWAKAEFGHRAAHATCYSPLQFEEALGDARAMRLVVAPYPGSRQGPPEILIPEAVGRNLRSHVAERAAAFVLAGTRGDRIGGMDRPEMEAVVRIRREMDRRTGLLTHEGFHDMWNRSTLDMDVPDASALAASLCDPLITSRWHRTHRRTFDLLRTRMEREFRDAAPELDVFAL